MNIHISEVEFTPSDGDDERAGLLGYLQVTVNGSLRLDGLTLRRARAGQLEISFPRRRGSFRPLDDSTHRAMEGQILAALKGLTP